MYMLGIDVVVTFMSSTDDLSVRGRDTSVDKSSTFQVGAEGSNSSGGLIWLTQCMNGRGRDYQLQMSYCTS